MSVSSVEELTSQRRGKKNGKGREYERVFRVWISNPSDSVETVLEADDLPDIYSDHPANSNLFLEEYDASPEGDGRQAFIVVCRYKSKRGLSFGSFVQDPTDLPPEITFGFVEEESVVDKAYAAEVAANDLTTLGDTEDGRTATIAAKNAALTFANQDPQGAPKHPVQNSARIDFDPPVVQPSSNLVISIRRNEKPRDFRPENVRKFKDTLNQTEITIADVSLTPAQGRLKNISANKRWDADEDPYWEVTYEIEVRSGGTWIRYLKDQGFYEIGDADGPDPITDNDGNLVTEPQLLDGFGNKVSTTDENQVRWLGFLTYYARDWNGLALPRSA